MRRASDIILSCSEAGDDWDDWDTVEYDKKTGKTKNIKKTKMFETKMFRKHRKTITTTFI